ncbi:hypothetical protein SELMODRAFT_410560 [Selaginella moellendorffii]|uniref:Uncharacterized protein n=1 Tax=Selaginella moellendorffii TaxID=88036 RepID=D8RF51_SELML|nr:hypothetical protein SELMODRAFT_410560 [Selaginella moellendorffii]
MASVLRQMTMGEASFLSLLTDIIGKTEKLQNNPPNLIPQESLVVTKEHSPFKLTQLEDGYGRGTTDCLGHVALVTQLLKQMAEAKLRLKTTVAAVFIANEENATVLGIGTDALMDAHELDFLKNDIEWIPPTNSLALEPVECLLGISQLMENFPTVVYQSRYIVQYRKGIHAIELASEALKEIQDCFYNDFPKVVPDLNNEAYTMDMTATRLWTLKLVKFFFARRPWECN